MSFRKLDEKGKPIPTDGRSTRKPATKLSRGKSLTHYEIFLTLTGDDGKRKDIRKRFWLADDREAEDKERELRHEEPVNALTWGKALEVWLNDDENKFSDGHIATSKNTIKVWTASFGENSTVEGTSLADYTAWIKEEAKKGTGRAAQVKHAHMLAIARWCRANGLIKEIPFEHAPKPKDRMKPRMAATVDVFASYLAVMPPEMSWLWRMLAATGVRITAACMLKEEDVFDTEFKVFTKFGKWVTYPLTEDITRIFNGAREYKSEKGFDSPYVFVNSAGRHWQKDIWRQRMVRLANKHELPKVTPHQLRHMAGTLLAENNMSADIIKAGLAHDSRVSAEAYIDQTQAMRKRALTALGQALRDVGKMSEKAENSANDGGKDKKTAETKGRRELDIECPCCHHKFKYNKE